MHMFVYWGTPTNKERHGTWMGTGTYAAEWSRGVGQQKKDWTDKLILEEINSLVLSPTEFTASPL